MPLHVTPIVLSALAGVTKNYFIGISSGFTLEWLVQVWEMYSDSIYLSLKIAIACVIVTFIFRRLAAYVMYRFPGLTSFIESLVMLPIAVPGMATYLGPNPRLWLCQFLTLKLGLYSIGMLFLRCPL